MLPKFSGTPAVLEKAGLDNSSFRAWECSHPVYVSVENLTYCVPAKELFPGLSVKCNGREGHSLDGWKVLLSNVSLSARPGEVLGIVGPSGGGKTTLLNAMALRSPASRIPEGDILYNGRKETKSTVKSTINYVMAHVKNLPYLTVQETLQNAADLKLPFQPKAERAARVEQIIQSMGLNACRNTYVGGEWRKGISTGEQKRLAIGIELLDEPSVLILDEPTTGLDSYMAGKVIEILRREARKGRTIIATVHQPSSQVFELFDRFTLLSKGQIMYSGPVDRALPYFESLGYVCGDDWNVSDFLLDLVSEHPSSSATTNGSEDEVLDRGANAPVALSAEAIQSLADRWRSSREAAELLEEIRTTTAKLQGAAEMQVAAPKGLAKAGKSVRKHLRKETCWLWFHQVATLWLRFTLNSLRNPMVGLVILLVQVLQGLVLGGIFISQRGHIKTGPKPEPILGDAFWENSWVKAYMYGVDGNGASPIVDMITRGLDGNGSYGIYDDDNTDYMRPLRYALRRVAPCVHRFWKLQDSYPALPEYTVEYDWQDGTWESSEWSAKDVYKEAMVAYQIFDFYAYTFDYKWFKSCEAKYADDTDVTNMYLCIADAGYFILSPLVECGGLTQMPDMGMNDDLRPDHPAHEVCIYDHQGSCQGIYKDEHTARLLRRLEDGHVGEEEKQRQQLGDFLTPMGLSAPDEMKNKAERLVKAFAHVLSRSPASESEEFRSMSFTDTLKSSSKVDGEFEKTHSNLEEASGIERRFEDLQQESQAQKRKLISISSAINLDSVLTDILGENLMQFVTAARKWADRATSCSHGLCKFFKSISDLVEDWSKETLQTISSVLNLTGCLFFAVANLGFASYDALVTFPQERALFNREAANGLYRASSYYVAKNIADLPFQLLPGLCMAIIFYFMVGYDATAKQFFIYFFVCALTTFCAYGFGYLVSAAAPRTEISVLVAPLTLVIWLTIAGFFLRDADIPAWISWFRYLSFYRWAFFALVINQFPSGGYFGSLPNKALLAICGVTESRLGLCVGVLAALGVSYRILGYIALAKTNRRVGLEA